MANNKVVLGNETLIDLTSDTVTEDTLLEGETAHDASGNVITGRAIAGGNIATVDEAGIVKPDGSTILVETDGTIHATNTRYGISGELINSDTAILSFKEGTYSIYAPNNPYLPNDAGVITINRAELVNGWLTVLFQTIDGHFWYRVAFSADTWWTEWIEVSSKSDIEAINTRLTTAEGNITTINGNISAINGNINTINGNINTINGKLTTAEGNITTLTTNVTTINTKLVDSADWLKSKNLFDKKSVVVGGFYRNGAYESNASWGVVHVPISGLSTISISGLSHNMGTQVEHCWENSSKARISKACGYNENKYENLTVPSGAEYIGISVITDNTLTQYYGDIDTIQVELGSSATTYAPYAKSNIELTNDVATLNNVSVFNGGKLLNSVGNANLQLGGNGNLRIDFITNSASNVPTGMGFDGILFTLSHNASYGCQYLMGASGFFYRYCAGGTWESWTKIQ